MHSCDSVVQTGNLLRTAPSIKYRELGCTIESMIREAAPAYGRNVGSITGLTLVELGLTSLRFVGLVVAMEEAFGLSEDVLQSLDGNMTVDALVALCDGDADAVPCANGAVRPVATQ